MFYIELKRSIHNKTILYLMTVTVLAHIMGWVLPWGLEGIDNISYEYYMFSTYTVFTQFGFLLFGFVTAYFYNKDYRDKNTIFFNAFGMNAYKYYFIKVTVLMLEEFICLLICSIGSLVVFHSNKFFVFGLLFFSAITLQYFMIVGAISLICKNMLLALGISISYWIISIVLISFGGFFKYLAVFDASNSLYSYVEQFLGGKGQIPTTCIEDIAVEFIILILSIIVICTCCRNSWIKKGV
ncbi:MAG: ABC transporter permease [Lachnospiraceae bacterium]|nr:ABC transporter permease [Lachnospiraceae bacterium]